MQQKGNINREDMLELTRRMTVSRNCFGRMAGAYFDEEGSIDGTFNIHFKNLAPGEQSANLKIAKAVPFSETNVELIESIFDVEEKKQGSVWQLLMGLRESELKNDGLLEIFYEMVGERYHFDQAFALYVFYGSYDVPLKGKDKADLGESEEVYSFLVVTICPVSGEYEPGEPIGGFLFPAFRKRSSDFNRIEIFQRSGEDVRRIFAANEKS